MITHADWEVRNSQRRYPIDESCSATGDNGVMLPESFLVDANIWVPKYLYDPTHPLVFVYLSSAQVSEGLVSLTILGCTEFRGAVEPVFVPLASISLPKPLDTYRAYPIEPLLDGVMGWVTFGQAANASEAQHWSFSTPGQATLCPKAARFYDYLPIQDAGVYGSSTTVLGDVAVVAQAPFTAELKDMRLDGELFDRRMLVLGLQELPDIMESFAGPCGKRPETGNCRNVPITSLAGVPPDCNGNITIQFDPEIFIRYFSNPAYPIDPLPIRGGMCLDSIYSVNQMCSKVQTLPDDNGILPGEYAYERPCDLTVPFSESFDGPDSFKRAQINTGYVYIDGSECFVTAGMLPSAEIAPCLAALPLEFESYTKRKHSVTFGETPYGSTVGMFALDTINTRILAQITVGPDISTAGTWKVSRFNKGLNDDDEVIASGAWPAGTGVGTVSVTIDSDRKVTVDLGGGYSGEFTLAPSDVYYSPTGKCGIYIGGATGGYDFTPSPAVSIATYSVQDL